MFVDIKVNGICTTVLKRSHSNNQTPEFSVQQLAEAAPGKWLVSLYCTRQGPKSVLIAVTVVVQLSSFELVNGLRQLR